MTSIFSSAGGLGGVGSTKDVLRDSSGQINLTTTSTTTGETTFVDLNISQIGFQSSAQTLTAGTESSTYTIESQDGIGAAINVDSDTTVGLSSSSSTGSFSTTSGGTFTTTLDVTITSGTSTATFFYKDTTAGTPTLTAAESPSSLDYTNGTQQQTVNAASISKLVFTTPARSIPTNTASDAITVQTQDTFGNASNVGSNTTIAFSSDAGGGTFSTSAGGTFTATLDVVISSGSSTATVFYKDTAIGSPTITADETPSAGYTAATQKQTIAALTVALTYSINRAVKEAEALTITATFNPAVKNGTTPTIAIDTSDVDQTATNMAGNTTVWTFAYTVPAGSEGTATVTIAAVNASDDANATATNNTFTIDNTGPTVALTYSPGRPVRNSDTLTITATFNEAITGTPQIAVDTTNTDLSATNMTDSGDQIIWTHTYDVPITSEGTATVTISGATDTATNATATATNNTFTIDDTGPTVALTYNPDRAVTDEDTLIITATFSSQINGTPTIAIDTSGTDLTATNMTDSGDQTVWTHSYAVPSDSEGTATVTLGGSTTDLALNSSAAATNDTFTIEAASSGSATVATFVGALKSDISVTMSVSPDPAAPGDKLTYIVTVSNKGPASSLAVTLRDTLPAGITHVSTSTSRGLCDGTSTIVCNLGIIGVGQIATIEIVVTADAEGTITNVAFVSSSRLDPSPANNSSRVTHTISSPLTVKVTYTPQPPVRAGETIVVTLTYSQIVNGVPKISIDTEGIDLDPTAMTDAGDGKVWTFSYVVPEDSDGLATITISGVADLSGDPAPQIADNTFTIDSTGPSANLTYQPDGPVSAGSILTITVTFDEAIIGIPRISIGTTGIDLAPTAMTDSGGGLVWTFEYTVPADSDGLASVSITGVTDEAGNPNREPDDDTFMINSVGPAVTISYSPQENIQAGDVVIITATFDGLIIGTPTITIDGVTVLLEPTVMTSVDGGLVWTYQYVVPEGAEGLATVTISGVTDAAGNPNREATNNTFFIRAGPPNVTLTYSTSEEIKPGDILTITATFDQAPATVPSISIDTAGVDLGPIAMTATEDGKVWIFTYTVPDGSEGEATVSITLPTDGGEAADLEPANNTFIIGAIVADLSVTLSGSPEPVLREGVLTYTLAVVNGGPSTATALVVTDRLDPAVVLLEVAPGPFTCQESSGVVTCILAELANGDSAEAVIEVSVDPTASGVIINSADVSSVQKDPDESNNQAVERTFVMVGELTYSVSARAGNLDATGITLTDFPDPVFVNDELEYTLKISNNGTGEISDVTLTVTLPGAVRFASATATIPSAVSGSAASIPERRPGEQTGPIPVTMTFLAPSISEDSFIVPLATPKISPEPAHGVRPIVDSSSEKETIRGWSITDLANLKVWSRAEGECTQEAGTIICDLGSLAREQSATVAITVVTVEAGILNNKAEVTTGDAGTGEAGARASESTTVLQLADLGIIKSLDPNAVIGTDQIAYTLTVTNEGPSMATGVTVTDHLPPGVLFLSSVQSGCVESQNLVTCAVGSLPVGETAIFTIKVAPASQGTFTNSAQVTGFEADPLVSNNSATQTVEFRFASKPAAPASTPIAAPTAGPTQIPTLIPEPTEVPAPTAPLETGATPDTSAPLQSQASGQNNRRLILIGATIGSLLFLLAGLFYFFVWRKRRRAREERR